MEASIGHNSEAESPAFKFTRDQIKAIIERIERLEEEKATIAGDIREIYVEAKGNGYCGKTLRKVVTMRKKNPADRAEEAAILETYLHALGME